MSTRCGLTSMKGRHNDDTSLDINGCTCPRCLRLVIIGDLIKRFHNINRSSVLQLQNVQEKRNDSSNL